MIENNIVQSLGAGSGIDSRSLVTQLTEIERSAPQTRIDTKTELRFASEEQRLDDVIVQLKSEIQNLKDTEEQRRLELQEKRRNLELEVEGKSGSGKAFLSILPFKVSGISSSIMNAVGTM